MIDTIYQRYENILLSLIQRGLECYAPPASRTDAMLIDTGLAFPKALIGKPLGKLPSSMAKVIDRAGHERPIYASLLGYAMLQARTLGAEIAEHWRSLPFVPAEGVTKAELTWRALVSYLAAPSENAISQFQQIAAGQDRNGALLPLAAGENPETNWYNELVILHALCSYAIHSGDAAAKQAVHRAGEYHMEETQPDHATSQPWAVHAFIWNKETLPLADQILHAAQVQHPEGLDAVSLILLADAVVCLRRLTSTQSQP